MPQKTQEQLDQEELDRIQFEKDYNRLVYGSETPKFAPSASATPSPAPSHQNFMQRLGAERLGFEEALATPEAQRAGQVGSAAAAIGTLPALGAAISGAGPGMIGLSAGLGTMTQPTNVAEAGADVSGFLFDVGLTAATKSPGAARLRSYLSKGGPMQQTFRRGLLEGAFTGATQVPLWATGHSDPGQTAAFMSGQIAAPLALVGTARGIASAMGYLEPNKVSEALQRLKIRTGQIGKTYGLAAETGGFGRKALEDFSETPLALGFKKNFVDPLQELVMRGLRREGGFGEVPTTKRIEKIAQETGFVFKEESVEAIQDRVMKRVSKPRIVVEPRKVEKVPQGYDPLTGRALPYETVVTPAVKRGIKDGDIIGFDRETGKIYANRPDEALKIPEGREDFIEVFKVDGRALEALKNAARRDPGSFAAAIGTNNKNLRLAVALRDYMLPEEFRVIQKDWLAQNLVAEALESSSAREGGVDVAEKFGDDVALYTNQFMKVNGDKLNKAWERIKSQKMLAMLEPEQQKAIDDIVTVVRELDIGAPKKGQTAVERFMGYGFNKVMFNFLSRGAVLAGGGAALGGAPEAAAGLLSAGVAMTSLGGLISLALSNPKTTTLLRKSMRGDIDAGRQLIRTMATSSDFVPVMHDENTVEFYPRPDSQQNPLRGMMQGQPGTSPTNDILQRLTAR